MTRRLPALSLVARLWLLATGGLLVAGIGLSTLYGVGWGLLLVGLGLAVAALLYDPRRSP